MTQLLGIHPVLEALRAKRPVERVVIAKGAGGARLQEVIDLCRERGVPARFEPRQVLDRMAPGSVHQGVIALTAAHYYADFDQAIEGAKLVVLLDGVEDPHNLGAIVRTAHAAGASVVVVPERRAVGITETVARAAAGALEHLPIARVGNVNRAIGALKARGFWIYGFDERGEHPYDAVDFMSPTALVLGGEGKGLHHQVKEHCDFLLRIPMAGPISSLNVSVAAGVVLFEWRRKQKAKG